MGLSLNYLFQGQTVTQKYVESFAFCGVSHDPFRIKYSRGQSELTLSWKSKGNRSAICMAVV